MNIRGEPKPRKRTPGDFRPPRKTTAYAAFVSPTERGPRDPRSRFRLDAGRGRRAIRRPTLPHATTCLGHTIRSSASVMSRWLNKRLDACLSIKTVGCDWTLARGQLRPKVLGPPQEQLRKIVNTLVPTHPRQPNRCSRDTVNTTPRTARRLRVNTFR